MLFAAFVGVVLFVLLQTVLAASEAIRARRLRRRRRAPPPMAWAPDPDRVRRIQRRLQVQQRKPAAREP